jgi:glycosyltransferase involved in cell wall biosynthesis
MRRALTPHGIDLTYLPSLTSAEYRVVTSAAPSPVKALTLGRAAARLLSRGPPRAALRLVHRLRFPIGLPRGGPGVDVYDFDDALPIGTVGSPNGRYTWLKREAQQSIRYLRSARLVLAGSPYLADLASRHSTRIEVVPSCVDPGAQPTRAHRDVEVVTVGWIGSRSTTPHLEEKLGVFERLVAAGVPVRLVAIGAETTFAAPWFSTRPWSLAREPEDLAGFDIGIMPMPDDLWTRGKCGYKALQYMAAGVPVVASPVGVARGIVEPDRGRLADSPSEWTAAICELAADTAMRRELGANGRRLAVREYSYARWAPEVATLLLSLAGGGAGSGSGERRAAHEPPEAASQQQGECPVAEQRGERRTGDTDQRNQHDVQGHVRN